MKIMLGNVGISWDHWDHVQIYKFMLTIGKCWENSYGNLWKMKPFLDFGGIDSFIGFYVYVDHREALGKYTLYHREVIGRMKKNQQITWHCLLEPKK